MFRILVCLCVDFKIFVFTCCDLGKVYLSGLICLMAFSGDRSILFIFSNLYSSLKLPLNKPSKIKKQCSKEVLAYYPWLVDKQPKEHEAPHFAEIADSFGQLWERIKPCVGYAVDILIRQLETALAGRDVTVNDQ